MYWTHKLHKPPYKARFIVSSSLCTTTHISKLLTSCLIKVKGSVIRYFNKAYENSGINLFRSIRTSTEFLPKLEHTGNTKFALLVRVTFQLFIPLYLINLSRSN